MERESSSEHEQSDKEESEDEEGDEQENIVESCALNIMLVGTYNHASISEVTLKQEKDEPILNVDDSGRFKGAKYSGNNDKTPSTSFEDPNKKESPPKQSPPSSKATSSKITFEEGSSQET